MAAASAAPGGKKHRQSCTSKTELLGEGVIDGAPERHRTNGVAWHARCNALVLLARCAHTVKVVNDC